jgi:hypothetical protein
MSEYSETQPPSTLRLDGAALSTVLGVGAELGATTNDSAIVTALRRGSTDWGNQSN